MVWDLLPAMTPEDRLPIQTRSRLEAPSSHRIFPDPPQLAFGEQFIWKQLRTVEIVVSVRPWEALGEGAQLASRPSLGHTEALEEGEGGGGGAGGSGELEGLLFSYLLDALNES